MKLFYAAGASSLAPHILLEESSLTYVVEKVNLDTKTWNEGQNDYKQINPKSYVPALKTDSGKIITECAVIMEYIAKKATTKNLIAEYDSQTYWQQRMWLNYIATELHKNFISPFRKGNWLPNTIDSKQLVYKRVLSRLKFVDQKLNQKNYLVNNQFSAPDAYLFVMTNWIHRLEYSFNNLANLKRFDNNMRKRLAVDKVLKQEGKAHSLQDKSN
ncbi:Glutathione S-transferase [Oenococcus oeni]|uniref:glutathione S-transferase N-terminal domain-containing protein n=1 Tax=Oenococcus oeni TaxID=1247 RepID=UPI0010784E34|nr:glutathione S-transferase N-terminal domain-containing protein [Oenococcus oeni]AVI94382.1 glutathione S-transferase [Oenococcus oeni]SYV99849.1 Glutathione S-transferase [Oenococcus oeni]SYW04125.1 Glutathione S-transferase [Oenococcus oeni]SYW17924.1 Glutathione S-transferase [Oenococcus oeni]VDC14945.1 Glutathione S-transferase [Oenococcus oeni]